MVRRRDIPKDEMLEAATRLLQTLGYNGFSIRDLAEEVGISAASLHHHFPSKAHLGIAVVERYRDRFNSELADIESSTEEWNTRWNRVVRWFERQQNDGGRVCVLGGLSHDFRTLPQELQASVHLLHGNMHGWLTRLVASARRSEQLETSLSSEDEASARLASLQGSLALARLNPSHGESGTLKWLRE